MSPTEYTGMASRDGKRVLQDDGEHCITCWQIVPRGLKPVAYVVPPVARPKTPASTIVLPANWTVGEAVEFWQRTVGKGVSK